MPLERISIYVTGKKNGVLLQICWATKIIGKRLKTSGTIKGNLTLVKTEKLQESTCIDYPTSASTRCHQLFQRVNTNSQRLTLL